MKAGVVGLATALMVSADVGSAGLPARFAQADPGACAPGKACMRWCPGDPDPAARPIPWDAGVCHDFYWDSVGVNDVSTGAFYA